MDNNNLNKAKDELSFIKNIIKDSREKLYDTGYHFIFWGIIIALGQSANYFTVRYGVSQYLGYIWIVLITLGWTLGIIVGKRERKIKRSDNFASKITKTLWLGGGIAMTIIGFSAAIQIGDVRIITSFAINPVISVILGILFFTTGVLYDMKWFSRIAYGWWIIGITLFYWKTIEGFLLYAVVMILFMVIPGIILNKNYKKIEQNRKIEVD